MNNKAYTRLIALALLILTLAACHEHDYYDPTPEVVVSYERWDYNSVSGTYNLVLDFENIGDADAYDIRAEFRFGTPMDEYAVKNIGYIPYGGRRTVVIYDLLRNYGLNYHADFYWSDYNGYTYHDYY